MKPKHLCLLLALCLLAGCAPSAATEEAVNPITFYYADAAEDYERATGALTGICGQLLAKRLSRAGGRRS